MHPVLTDPFIPQGPWSSAIADWALGNQALDPAPKEYPWGEVLTQEEFVALAQKCFTEGRRPGIYGENRRFSAGVGFGNHYGYPLRGFQIRDCSIGVSNVPSSAPARWCVRAYDVTDSMIEGSCFLGTTPTSSAVWHEVQEGPLTKAMQENPVLDEHGVYVNVAGDFAIQGSVFVECAAQGIQEVFRTGHETVNDSWAVAPGMNRVEHCALLECGRWWGKARGGFALSMFATGQDALIDRTLIRNVNGAAWTDGNGLPCNSFGALLLEGRRRALVSECYLEHRAPDKELVKVDGCRETTFRRTRFERAPGDSKVLRIVVRDCGIVRFEECFFPEHFEIVVQGKHPQALELIDPRGSMPTIQA